jgi:tripartite-type tricarboxylate transporter receptor subunit TctC
VRTGTVKAIVVTAKTRLAVAPEVQSVEEGGLPGLQMLGWFGLFAPKGTPADIISKLNAALVDTLADQGIRKRLADLGQDIPPRDQQTPEALRAFHRADVEKWWPIIRASGIKAE